MPFKRPFTDTETGAEYPDAFWYPASFHVGYNSQEIGAVYVGHISENHLDKKPVHVMTREFRVTGPAFVALLRQIAQAPPPAEPTPLPIAVAAMLDQIALQIKDVPTGEVDGEGKPVLVSFFEGCEPLPPDLSVLR